MKKKASISEDGKYRWLLTRRWDYNKSTLTWIMLNPSSADGQYDTPTIERVIRMSKILGYGGCVVVNLYAWRTPKASDLRRMSQTRAIGARNNYVLRRAGSLCRAHGLPVMVAWGSQALTSRAKFVISEFFTGVELKCLGLNKSGHPIHPLSGTVIVDQVKQEVKPWSLDDLETH